MAQKKQSNNKLIQRFKHLKKDLPAVYITMKDSRTPLLAKAIALGIVVYALSPIDLIPDFVPILGYLDDVIILPALMYLLIKVIPNDIWTEAQVKSENMWINGKPKKWYYALPIIIFWIVIVLLIFYWYKQSHT